MEEIFADAFYWIALANPTDQWHDAVDRFDKENPQTLIVTTEEVLTEFLNFYSEVGRHRRRIVGHMTRQVVAHPQITVLEQSTLTFRTGLNLFQQREDKGYSLTDCISMSAMRDRSIQRVLTHDDHFEQEGFIVLF